jgi:hypothetical protein
VSAFGCRNTLAGSGQPSSPPGGTHRATNTPCLFFCQPEKILAHALLLVVRSRMLHIRTMGVKTVDMEKTTIITDETGMK